MYVLTNDLCQIALPDEWTHRESTLTVGAFDGIHVGHRSLIEQLVARANQEGRLAGLVTFYPHPAAVLHPQRRLRYLTTPGEKAVILEPTGLDWLAILPFNAELAATSPRVFIRHLYRQMNMRSLWIGADFAMGRDREGDAATLRRLGREIGFDIQEVSYVTQDGIRASSSQVRTLLQHGRVREVTRLLDRCYAISGEVIHGAQRGRCIGFPTANVDVRHDRVIPADGIYAGYASLGSERYRAVLYVGHRPSFDHGPRSIEAHLLDYEGDLYGCDLVIEFAARLRGDRRFPDVKDLIAQIGRDVENARRILDPAAPCSASSSPSERGAAVRREL